MRVVVITVYAPRPDHPRWMDYVPLLHAQKRSVLRAGHKHVVVTDAAALDGFRVIKTALSPDLMRAVVEGVVIGLRASNGKHHVVFLDADCLVVKPLDEVFAAGDWDIGLTRRVSAKSPINNGVMYVRNTGIANAINFFERALELMDGTHWGADQESISAAAAPVPDMECVEERSGARVAFFSMKLHGCALKRFTPRHRPYVLHFKGENKALMLAYASSFLQ